MQPMLLVMAGGAIGAGLRHAVGRWAVAQFGAGFPVGTLIVNLAGGLAIGLVAGALLRGGIGPGTGLFLTTGLLGGFTTFSAFSLELVALVERGQPGLAAGYALVSVVASGALAWAGLLMVRGAAA